MLLNIKILHNDLHKDMIIVEDSKKWVVEKISMKYLPLRWSPCVFLTFVPLWSPLRGREPAPSHAPPAWTAVAAAPASSHRVVLTREATPLVGRVRRALDRLAARACHAGRLVAFLAGHDGELHRLAVADRAHRLARVVPGDRRLMYEHILLRVIPVDEPVSALHIEPFDSARNFICDDRLFLGRFRLLGLRCLLRLLLLLRRLLGISHDVIGERRWWLDGKFLHNLAFLDVSPLLRQSILHKTD